MIFHPLFVPSGPRNLFLVQHIACDPAVVERRVLIVPPLFEELNKSRRLFALIAEKLAALGMECVIADISGTGDSDGELSELVWQDWLDDLDSIHDWINEQTPKVPLSILSCRASALLVNDWLARRMPDIHSMTLVQPCTSGKTYCNQFLRLRVLANRFAGVDESLADIRFMLDEGKHVEVAGYSLTNQLFTGLESIDLKDYCQNTVGGLDIIQVSSGSHQNLSPSLKKLLDTWSGQNRVGSHHVDAESFWLTQEISAPKKVIDLVTKTLSINQKYNG